MIIYNVTTKVHHEIAEDWLRWMQEEHVSELVNTGCFIDALIMQLLESDDSEGLTYAVQYRAIDMVSYQRYIDEFADDFRKDIFEKWGNRFISFRSLLKVIE